MGEDSKHYPVIFISGWYPPMDGKPYSYFNGYPSWKTFRSDRAQTSIHTAINYIKWLVDEHGERWHKEFRNKFGNGYNDWFSKMDGSVSLGYELMTCGCFPQWIAICIKHMYYGK